WAVPYVLALSLTTSHASAAGDDLKTANRLEQSGDAAAARNALLSALDQNPNDPALLGAYAGFLDRYDDAKARVVYRKWLASVPPSSADARAISRRLVVLDLIEGDRAAVASDLAAYRAAGGDDLNLPGATANVAAEPQPDSDF